MRIEIDEMDCWRPIDCCLCEQIGLISWDGLIACVEWIELDMISWNIHREFDLGGLIDNMRMDRFNIV